MKIHTSACSRSCKALFIFVLLSLSLSCGYQGPQFPQAPVILITVDTLRSDRLPAYGYTGVKTPFIDDLASQSILFERAYAHSPMTLPSHATLMTGMLPTTHGVRENIGFLLPESPLTMAEIFKDAGYQTAGFVSSMVLRPQTGIAQGFDYYEGPFQNQNKSNVRSFAQIDGAETLEKARKWAIAHKEKPFFLWVHIYEPHTPYTPPPPFNQQYQDGYDGEIAYSDHLLGTFAKSLKQHKLYDEAVFLLTSDHGESLGEHGEKEHGLFVYRPAVQVPFILKLPQQQDAGKRITAPIGLVDVMPTLTQLAGIKANPHDGIVLLSYKNPPSNRKLYSEAMTAALFYGWHAHRGVLEGDMHYLQGAEPEIFNLDQDPNQLTNLSKIEKIPAKIAKTLAEVDMANRSEATISEEDKAMLASLGYSGGFDMGSEILGLSKDQFLALYDEFDLIIQGINGSNFADAETRLVPLLQKYPTMVEARVLLGFVLRQQEKLEQAAHVYMEGMALHSKDMSMLKGLALTQLRLGDFEKAKTVALKAAEINPSEILEDLIPSFFDYEQYDVVEKLLAAVQPHVNDYAFGTFAIGKIANRRKDYQKANQYLTQAVALASEQENDDVGKRAIFWLGDTYARQGNLRSALNLFQQLLNQNPNHAGARASMSMVYASQKQPRKAIQVLDEWVAAYPTYENLMKAYDTMQQIGLSQPAAFYKQAAERVKAQADKKDQP